MLIHQPNITGSLLVNGEESAGTGFPFSGSAIITGSLEVSGSTISGSFIGDGSGIQNIPSASFATTASYAVSASHEITLEVSSSYADTAQTSSYADTFTISNSLTLPIGTSSERPTNPFVGNIRFNTTSNQLEIYNGTIWGSVSFNNQISVQSALSSVEVFDSVFASPIEVEYLVIAGGGGGGVWAGSGGGAGGYRSSVSGESSGRGASAETPIVVTPDVNYTVTVGSGGASKSTNNAVGGIGNDSVFATITSLGGGGGGGDTSFGLDGGSGGGGGGLGTVGQGYDGAGSGGRSHGGGGASQNGVLGAYQDPGEGGDGVSSSITGSSVTRAGGGGGVYAGISATGGAGGGGAGGANGVSGTTNTGGGGGGGDYNGSSGAGGSGVVILRYPSSISITVGAGLTSSTTTVGANKVTTFTAGTDTISFS